MRTAVSGRKAPSLAKPGDQIVVAHEDDLRDGHMKLLHINGQRIALARVGDDFLAVGLMAARIEAGPWPAVWSLAAGSSASRARLP